MGRIRQTIFSASLDSSDPAEILRKVNRVLLLQESTMATALVGIIDPHTHRVQYASAGHSLPIFACDGKAAYVESAGLALGIQPDLDLTVQTLQPQADSLLVLYTDGVTEADRNPAAGEARLLGATAAVYAEARFDMPARRIYEGALDRRPHEDDIAILVIRFLDPAAKGGVSSIQSRPFGMAWDFNSSDAEAAQRARRQIVEFIRRNETGRSDPFAIESIVGELIANTVDHAPGAVHIDIDWTDASPTLTVHDTGLPFDLDDDAKLPDLLSEDGRGLYLIRTFGATVRIQRSQSCGKDVVSVLPVVRSLSA
jgi:anti-sigma regulatory factor (Ser/Thr protein kinase)